MSQRLDKWLCYARIVKHRARAQELVEGGSVRINRNRVNKPSWSLKAGDILTVVLESHVRVLKVLGEAPRRGPASQAQQLYEDLTPDEKSHASGPGLCY